MIFGFIIMYCNFKHLFSEIFPVPAPVPGGKCISRSRFPVFDSRTGNANPI